MQFTSVKNLTRSSPEIGRIKIGSLGEARTSQGGKTFRLPKKLDHFEVVTRFRGPDGTFTRDEDIHAPVVDYNEDYPQMTGRTVGEVTYAELRRGWIEWEGRKVPCFPLSSYRAALEIAETLKGWMLDGGFLLGKPVELLPSAS